MEYCVECEDELIDLFPLLALGSDVGDYRDPDRWTALLRAAPSPSTDWNVGDSNGITPLYWALVLGYKVVVKRLLDIPGINCQVKTHDGETLAHAAVDSGDDEIVALLSDVPSVDWNVGDSNEMTPLYIALSLGYKDVVKRILDIPGINYSAVNWVAPGLT